MGLAEMVSLGVALSGDIFSVSVALGTAGMRWRRGVQFAAALGIVHVVMLLTGLYAGETLEWLALQAAGVWYRPDLGAALMNSGYQQVAEECLHLVGAGLLLYLGARMMAAFVFGDSAGLQPYPVSLKEWGVLAVSMSLDATSVGLGLGVFEVNVVELVAVVGIVVGILTFAGVGLGKELKTRIGPVAQLAGGVILFYFGVNAAVASARALWLY